MKINIISYEPVDSWILGKFAKELEKHLLVLGQDVVISDRADKKYDINHHIIYTGYDNRVTNTDTLMLTHIDYVSKAFAVKERMRYAKLGICMSKETMHRLSALGIPRRKLCYVNPAHNDSLQPRKIIIGITSRLYSYGLKREYFLLKLSQEIDPGYFKFIIMGNGWQYIVTKLQSDGFEVEYHPDFILDEYVTLMSRLDYYLYMGEDEGSMGFVDALFCGVKTIATSQGFHLDAKGGLTHGFTTFTELVDIFQKIQSDRQARWLSVESWTWENYALKHLEIWRYLLNEGSEGSFDCDDGINALLDQSENPISRKEAWQAIMRTNLRLGMAAWKHIPYRFLRRITPDPVVTFAKQVLRTKKST